jgi:hypothetical protein
LQPHEEITMSQNYNPLESIVEKLIHEHFDLDENLEKVMWINPEKTSEIRLIQITADTFPTGDVLSFYFPPSKEVPYPLLIAQVTPEEWRQVLRDEIPLPEEWSLKNHKVFSRELVAA